MIMQMKNKMEEASRIYREASQTLTIYHDNILVCVGHEILTRPHIQALS